MYKNGHNVRFEVLIHKVGTVWIRIEWERKKDFEIDRWCSRAGSFRTILNDTATSECDVT